MILMGFEMGSGPIGTHYDLLIFCLLRINVTQNFYIQKLRSTLLRPPHQLWYFRTRSPLPWLILHFLHPELGRRCRHEAGESVRVMRVSTFWYRSWWWSRSCRILARTLLFLSPMRTSNRGKIFLFLINNFNFNFNFFITTHWSRSNEL